MSSAERKVNKTAVRALPREKTLHFFRAMCYNSNTVNNSEEINENTRPQIYAIYE